MAGGAGRKLGRAVLLGAPVVILAAGGWHRRWMSDDGFINLRVVSQIRAGHGPVFNAGERVEATTSTLWVLFLTVGDVVTPLRLEWIAVLAGIGLTLTGVVLAIWGSMQLQRRPTQHTVWIPAGALVLAVFAPMWRFSSSGLETGMTFAWLGLSLALLARWSVTERRLSWWAAVLLGLGPLVRPELSLVSIAFVVAVLVGQRDERDWRSRLAVVGAAFALPTAYQIFRMGYYGSLVPNTAFAKEAMRSYWSSGIVYLRRTVIDSYALWIPILVLVAGALVPLLAMLRTARRRRSALVVAAFSGSAVVEALYVVHVGGDFLDNRFLLPALFLLVAPIAVVPATRRFVAALVVVPWSIVALAALRGPQDGVSRAFVVGTPNPVTLADFGMARGGPERRHFEGDGVHYLQRRLPGTPSAHDPALATYGVGIPSYSLGPDTYVLDLFGLADPFTAHLELERRSLVAHEKPLPRPWIPARLLKLGAPVDLADLPLPGLFFTRSLEAAGDRSFTRRVRDARQVLDCPRLAEFFATYRAPLDTGRFLDNLGEAFSNYGFRIPPEPRRALAEIC